MELKCWDFSLDYFVVCEVGCSSDVRWLTTKNFSTLNLINWYSTMSSREILLSLIYKVIKLNCWLKFILYGCVPTFLYIFLLFFYPKKLNYFTFIPYFILYCLSFDINYANYEPAYWNSPEVFPLYFMMALSFAFNL